MPIYPKCSLALPTYIWSDHFTFLADVIFEKNKHPNWNHFLERPFYKFIHQYFFRLEFLDGKESLILPYLSRFPVFKRYLFLWIMYKNID